MSPISLETMMSKKNNAEISEIVGESFDELSTASLSALREKSKINFSFTLFRTIIVGNCF